MLETTISMIAVRLSYKNTHLICKKLEKIQSKQITLREFSEVIISLRIFNESRDKTSMLRTANLSKSVFLKKKLKKIKLKKFNKGKNNISKYINLYKKSSTLRLNVR